jgi:CheY-like chemotaxis protein
MSRVLVVDDDPDLQDALAEAVAIAGHDVRVASNGREALEVMRRHPVELVLLDMMMPVMDGQQFRAEQRRDPTIAHVPVIVVSAASPIPVVDAAAILSKPVDLDALLDAVDRHALRGP